MPPPPPGPTPWPLLLPPVGAVPPPQRHLTGASFLNHYEALGVWEPAHTPNTGKVGRTSELFGLCYGYKGAKGKV